MAVGNLSGPGVLRVLELTPSGFAAFFGRMFPIQIWGSNLPFSAYRCNAMRKREFQRLARTLQENVRTRLSKLNHIIP